MAELMPIEEKLAEVLGLARAARDVTEKVGRFARDEGEDEVRKMLERMHDEAAETEKRCLAVAQEREGKKTAIEEKARETRREATEMMNIYLGEDSDVLDGLEFLSMAEAGELRHVEIVRVMNDRVVRDREIDELIEFAQPIQERHVGEVREAALRLAAEEAANGS